MKYLAPIAAAAVIGLSAPYAHACACCADAGARMLHTEPFAVFIGTEARTLGFDPTTWPFFGAGEDSAPMGIKPVSEAYETIATWSDKGLTLELTGTSPDRSGSLSLAVPQNVTIFSVDPTPGSQETNVALYKEWRMATTAAGTGAFAAVRPDQHTAVLIFYGSGNNCDIAGAMTNWSLEVKGPGVDFRLFGKLTGQ